MTDTWASTAEEFLHLYPAGPRTIGVAGADAERSRAAADALEQTLRAQGQDVVRAHTDEGEESALREEIIAPFRIDPSDRILLVSGPAALLSPGARGLWNFSVWQLADEEAPHTAASALVDVTDPSHPARRFADYCALPAAYGA